MWRIIFDNDGVNIDSEDLAMRIADDWINALVRRYVPDADLPSDYIYNNYAGTSTDRIVEAMIEKFNLPRSRIIADYQLSSEEPDIAIDLADRITVETNRRFQAELKAVSGTTQALMQVRDLIGAKNMALATTSRRDRMNVSLACAVDPETGENARLTEIFPEGHRRRSGYGYPNKYDEAFGALQWNPDKTIIVEDSLSGVKKAKTGRHSTPVIGTVAARFYQNKEAQASTLLAEGAYIVLTNMLDLPLAVKWIQGGMNPVAQPNFLSPVFLPPAKTQRLLQRPAYMPT